ncbi:hypothetical protein TNCV_2126271 [Trichonephila clavipes]|nr:hypothetical protein TNCV_2126271 [Trichonephila clavipes]
MLNGSTELRRRFCNWRLLLYGGDPSLYAKVQGDHGPDFVFMDDSARPHPTADAQQLMESEDSLQWIGQHFPLN